MTGDVRGLEMREEISGQTSEKNETKQNKKKPLNEIAEEYI